MFLTFSNTILLIGLAGAVVPLVLHLLSRARYQTVEWGAMIFLEGVEGRPQHRARLGQVLLLAVRMAIVGLLAVALAEPMLQHWSPDADATAAALRAASRGVLLSIGGATACGVAIMLVIILAGTSIKESGVRWWHGLFAVGAVAAVIGLMSAVQRAGHWQNEVHRYRALQAQNPTPATDGGLRLHIDAAILLDCSPSMDFDENGHTRFSIAQGAAKQVLAGLHRGDRAMLMLMGQRQIAAELEPTTDLQSVADRIDSARPGHGPADVASALVRTVGVLDRAGHYARDLYIVGDRQALSWRGVDGLFLQNRWPSLLRDSEAPTRIFAVPVGNQDSDNLAVEAIELATAPAIVGQPAQLWAEVRNYGGVSRAALPLAVTVNGRTVFETTVNVPAGQQIRVSASLGPNAFSVPGQQVVSAEIRTTGYTDDDHYQSIIDVIDPIRVLVISGDEWQGSSDRFRSESDFLKLALAPFHSAGHPGADPCAVDVRTAEAWDQGIDLRPYQVVVLANVEQFSETQAREIEQYVYGGGGVLIAPGSLARIDSYNDQLWREGSGILPAQLEDATSADGSEATALVGYDQATPVFSFLHDRPDLMLSPTIGRYFPADATTADAKVLAWYTSGSPFLIETHAGRGRLLLMTTSLDADWSTLPLSTFYLPFVQSAVRYLAAGTLPSHNLKSGDPIDITFTQPIEDNGVLDLPDGDTRPVNVTRFGSTAELHIPDVRDPGIYHVRFNGPQGEQTNVFAVHGSHEESDLTPLTEDQWLALEKGLRLRRIDPNDKPVAASVAGVRNGYDLTPWAITLALFLTGMELVLARHWSRDAF